ncbi:OmpA/MotB family protein [Pseudodesulfovibrio tunisiensis]|uniref:OmpA/MotB family protein n=1 Tax=Pseudodesulfovibrio tunisiensis TaxID=463192 RepID=UPI001FB42D7A|nr:OmpA family protein [Pseudodesulfovibrio tunisiensis]
MRIPDSDLTKKFSSFEDFETTAAARGLNDWVVPWADLMMVMFVLFVVLFIYASTHKDVRVLFSPETASRAEAVGTLDPLIGLIGGISSQADQYASRNTVHVGGREVVFKSRADGVTVVQDREGRTRITLRGGLFFQAGEAGLNASAGQYLGEIAGLLRVSAGRVHVIGYSSANEADGVQSFALSGDRARSVAEYFIRESHIDPKRVILSGRGMYAPELPDSSVANQERNRRVEIVLFNES